MIVRTTIQNAIQDLMDRVSILEHNFTVINDLNETLQLNLDKRDSRIEELEAVIADIHEKTKGKS